MPGEYLLRGEGKCDLATAVEESLLDELGIRLTEAERRDPVIRLNRIKRALHAEPTPRLLIFDNVDEPMLMAEVAALPDADRVHILATTRVEESRWPKARQPFRFIPVDRLDRDAGAALMAKHRSQVSEAETEAALGIATELDGYPFALEVVGVTLAHRPDTSYQAYLEDMRARGIVLNLNRSGAFLEQNELPLSRHDETVLTQLLEPILDTLSPAEHEVLALAALCCRRIWCRCPGYERLRLVPTQS